jgi:hypothetical protein
MNPGTRPAQMLDVLTNIATLAAACAVIVVSWSRSSATSTPERRAANRPSVQTGIPVSIADVDWKLSRETAVLVLSTHCSYCVDSTAFYREISKRRKSGALRLDAVFTDELSAGKTFLSRHNLDVDQVLHQPLEGTGFKGTPTLLLVDTLGTLVEAWAGKVPSSVEETVLQRLSTRI